jgi:hypothetical protein
MHVFIPLQSKHLFIHHAIVAAILVFRPLEAGAQADPNLQSRLTTFSPSITVLQPTIASEVTKKKPVANSSCRLIKDPRLADLAAKLHNEAAAATNTLRDSKQAAVNRDSFIKHPEGTVDNEKISQELQRPEVREYLRTHPGRKSFFTALTLPIAFKCGAPQVLAVKISLPFNPTYETNVLKSNIDVHPDTSLGYGGNILVTGPGVDGRPYDVMGFSASSASARYSNFPSKSFDALTEQGIYQAFLGAHHIDGTTIDVTREELANLLTIDTLALGFVNQTAFMPGYHNETADLFTPQATLARQNIALASDLCSTSKQPSSATSSMPTKAPPSDEVKRLGFCYYLDLAVTVGQTFSDVIAQQNFNIAGSATLGWRVSDSNWKLTLPVAATARDYENVLGSRRDVLFQIGPAATYVLPSKPGDPSLMFSLAVTYNWNCSTLSTAAWHGLVVQPTLTVAFQPPAAVKPDQAN